MLGTVTCTPEIAFTNVDFPCATWPIVPRNMYNVRNCSYILYASILLFATRPCYCSTRSDHRVIPTVKLLTVIDGTSWLLNHRWWLHIRVVGGEAMQAALTLMRVSTPVHPREAVEWSAAGWFLEGSLEGLILAVTHIQQPLITVGECWRYDYDRWALC